MPTFLASSSVIIMAGLAILGVANPFRIRNMTTSCVSPSKKSEKPLIALICPQTSSVKLDNAHKVGASRGITRGR